MSEELLDRIDPTGDYYALKLVTDDTSMREFTFSVIESIFSIRQEFGKFTEIESIKKRSVERFGANLVWGPIPREKLPKYFGAGFIILVVQGGFVSSAAIPVPKPDVELDIGDSTTFH